ncbi:1,6-anhydro-N-acetylmuramyl-L-alanine amidase AmpD [Pseudomaricurvus sp. HS19]|uniref:1,6-anhydro-N-acetylmuramyl-L-alanine amidase AmpD n=1 Tax=Pseudomaricurvus sp. HS19 TaxID=2692626 RepID=UPI00136BA381|nr:1,6-anhydro-N-acetylmuramyl-L-alanine amidase AmpD [Pseudomaricurvus sp. HS19]MYM64718.1 1,6-anhydro-N-acetylmuramyl-L-alanine amidase AmpD [Pseudomaricurvus sp. HS19]
MPSVPDPVADTVAALTIDGDGWLVNGSRQPSPNYDDRPDPEDVSLLVIHNISLPPGQFGTGCVQDFFCNRLDTAAHPFFAEIADLRVSAHFLLERDGSITQFVPTRGRAWHAGKSRFLGRGVCNDFAVGIEVEGTDTEAYTDQQYAQLARLTRALMARHPAITPARITGHSHIAPGRKTDPGPAFDWQRLFAGAGMTGIPDPLVQES